MSVIPGFRTETMKGGEIIAKLLAAEGVDCVFGIIDGTYFGMYSAFEKYGIRFVTPRHESSAVHMAGAYARATGKLGVCIASNGPGVANALPGVAVEHAEGNRVLLITSCRRTGTSNPDRGGTFQCFDQTAVIGAMAKDSVAVPTAARIAEITRRSLRLGWTGKPGVVHLDVPEDLMNAPTTPNPAWFSEPDTYRVTLPLAPRAQQVERAAIMLRAAKRPLIHAGTGVVHAGASKALMRVADLLHAPITTSWGGRPAVDERHPLSVPMPYVDTVNKARNEADLVLVLGSRLGETDWWAKPPYWAPADKQQLIQVDLDQSIIGVNRPAYPIEADVLEFLNALADELAGDRADHTGRVKWMKALDKSKAKRRKQLDKHLSKKMMPMHPAHVPNTCRALFDDDAILVVDGGNTAIWANFFHTIHTPNTILTTPKMGMLGAGVSQTLGAAVAFPDRQVYCIIGDGAMGFHPQEVETAVRNNLNVIYFVMCDKQWGMVKINQQFALKPLKTLVKGTLSADETINADLGEIRFDDMARSMGAHGERVADPAGLKGAIERSMRSGKPAVIHVDVDPVAHLWAPNLKTFKDMHAEPKG